MNSYRDFAIDLAMQAGNLLKQRFQSSGTPAKLKPDHSFVTEVDLAADQLIAQAIHQQAPDEILLSEEMHTSITSLEPAVWIVDPLDGTTNYSLGLHVWGVSIARLLAGQPELGVLYFPLTNELFVAEKGHGAYCNDSRIGVRQPVSSQPWPFFACCSRTHRRYNISIPYKPRIYGSAAYSFCLLARGAAAVAFEATPKIWDLAAVWLLVQEAGGVFAQLAGETPFPVIPFHDYVKVSYPTLAAASSDLLAASLQQIHPKQ
jgi:myo-inositol-1(or 4)-monophosphatase